MNEREIFCDALVDKAEPIETKAVAGLRDLPEGRHPGVLVQRVVGDVRGRAEPDAAVGVPAGGRSCGRKRSYVPTLMTPAKVVPELSSKTAVGAAGPEVGAQSMLREHECATMTTGLTVALPGRRRSAAPAPRSWGRPRAPRRRRPARPALGGGHQRRRSAGGRGQAGHARATSGTSPTRPARTSTPRWTSWDKARREGTAASECASIAGDFSEIADDNPGSDRGPGQPGGGAARVRPRRRGAEDLGAAGVAELRAGAGPDGLRRLEGRRQARAETLFNRAIEADKQHRVGRRPAEPGADPARAGPAHQQRRRARAAERRRCRPTCARCWRSTATT